MREIIFKGFSPNEDGKETIYLNGEEIKGEWVFGSYHTYQDFNIVTGKRLGCISIIKEQTKLGKDYEILPETLSQFTGLLDKAGNKIFENDVVKILYTDWMSQPESDTRTLAEYLDSLTIKVEVVFENGKYRLFKEGIEYSIYCGKYGYIEVIGNHWQKEFV